MPPPKLEAAKLSMPIIENKKPVMPVYKPPQVIPAKPQPVYYQPPVPPVPKPAPKPSSNHAQITDAQIVNFINKNVDEEVDRQIEDEKDQIRRELAQYREQQHKSIENFYRKQRPSKYTMPSYKNPPAPVDRQSENYNHFTGEVNY